MSRKRQTKRSGSRASPPATPSATPAGKRRGAPPAARLARWLEANRKRLLPAGAGTTPADRRLSRRLLDEILERLQPKGGGHRRSSRAPADPARGILLLGALRDRVFTLLDELPARESRTLRRAAGLAFESYLKERFPVEPAGPGGEARSPGIPLLRGNGNDGLTRRLLERVFEDSEQAIFVYDGTGKILHANLAVAGWYGYSHRELVNLNVRDLIAPPYRHQLEPRLRKLLREKHRVTEALHVRRDGVRFDVEVSSWVLRGGSRPRFVSILRDITERREAKRALDLVLSGAPCLLWQATVEGEDARSDWVPTPLDEVAAQAFLSLNLRSGESYGEAWLRSRLDPGGARDREIAGEAIRKGESAYSQEYACRDALGETRWIHEDVRIEPLDRDHWRLTGLCTDLTARRSAEEALRENVERFQKVFEEGPLGMALVGPEISFVRVNRTLCEMLGYSESELTGKRVVQVTHPDDIETKLELFSKAFEGEIPYFMIETRYLRKNGDTLWVNLTASILRDADGKPLNGLVMIEDITERRRASADLERRVDERTRALTESHRRNETILRTTIDGYFVLDAKGRFIEVNDAYCAMTGYSRDEILGMRLSEIEAIASEKVIAANLRRIMRIGEDRFETRHRRKDGSQINIEISVNFLPDEEGGRCIVFARDITARKRDLRALKDSEERFRTIFENAPILVDSFDSDGRCVLWNKECERTLGWTKQEVMESEDPLALAYPDPGVRAKVLETIQRADGKFREYEIRAKDGSVRVQLWADFKLPAGSRISTGLDITARKQAENALRDARDQMERRVEERTAELRDAVAALEQEVAERERVEVDLRESEAKLTSLIENASEAIWSIDTDRRIVAFNSYFRERFVQAFGAEPMVGRTLDELLTDPGMQPVRDYLRSQIDRTLAGESLAVDTSYRLDGVKRYYIISLQPVVSSGVVRGATIYGKDITELKLAEKALAYQVEFEKLIAEVSQRFISVSPDDLGAAVEEMLELVGKFTRADRSRLFLFSPDLSFLEKVYEWCAEGVSPKAERMRRIPADTPPRLSRKLMRSGFLALNKIADLPPGNEVIAREFEKEGIRSLLAVPLLSEGAQIGFMGLHAVRQEQEWPEETVRLLRIVAEITANAIERTRAQAELKDLGRQHQLILDSAGEGIFGIDSEGRATFVNPAASRMLGWEPQEIIGERIHPLFHHTRPDGAPCVPAACPILKVFSDGEVRHVEDCLFWRRNGESFPVEFICNPIREEGRIVGAVVTFKDIGERKRGEEALRRVVEGTSSTLGEGFFRSLVQHLAAALNVRFAFVAELKESPKDEIRVLAFWNGEGFGEPFDCALPGTPCEQVFLEGQASFRDGVQALFPEDDWLREVGAQSYLAMVLRDARGNPIGHLAVLDDRPIENEAAMEPILRIFAARAGAELERKHAEETLAQQLELEKIVGAVSKRFVNVAPEETSAAIDDALRLIGTFSQVDRAYLFRFSDDLGAMENSNEWCAEGIEPQIDRLRNLPTDGFSWATSRLLRQETVQVVRLDDLPPEAAAEKREFEAQSIKSLVNVPVIYRNAVLGFVGFDSVRTEKTWSPSAVRLLELFAETMANALARERAERDFKELSHKNQLILDAAGEGILGIDMEGRATLVNPAAARMLGCEAIDIVGRSVHAVVHGGESGRAFHDAEACPIEASLRARRVQRLEEDLFRRRDGSTFPVEFLCTPLLERGRQVGVVATFNDITLRKRAEELRYQAHLLSQVPDAVLVIDEQGGIVFWSTGAENLTGYSAEEVIGKSLDLLLAEGDPGGGLPMILHQISGEGTAQDYQGEHLVRRKDGFTRLIGMHLSASPDPDGKKRTWIGVAQDVTESRTLQEEVIQAQRLAEVGTLAAGVAHEINNPLTVLSGNIQMMLERAGPDDRNRERYAQMKRVSDRISEVVDSLSRISAPRGEQWVLTNANDVVEDTLLLVEQLHGRQGVRIIRRYAQDLPKLRLLQNGLQQLVLNIVMNAMGAIQGDGEIRVETSRGPDSFQPRRGFLSPTGNPPMSRAPEGPSVRIRISDTGSGIPEENLSQIFLPFFTTKEPGKGTGLGLAVARSIVSIHRGSIEVESKVGRGTTFTVTLPAS